MPEIRPRSSTRSSQPRPAAKRNRRPTAADLRAELLSLLFQIQLNTADLCGRHLADKETAETLHATQKAVRRIRALLKTVLVLPRCGVLWETLIKLSIAASRGTQSHAASLIGLSRRQLERLLPVSPS